jgi:epoxyqueuosine reductase
LEDQIKAAAAALGFDLVGITSADPPAHIEFYRRWIAGGRHGEMGYLARQIERRADPRVLVPGAKSIVVAGCNYHTTDSRPGPTQGRIARYALGDDYHDVVRRKLNALADAVRELAPQAQARVYVDTGAVLERDLARRAGLGWIGKNTMLFNNRCGQWLLLGEILLNLPLQPDPPETRDRCGRCTRCIAACPTRAITAPYRLDARRCISYLTIELKGSIPVELRPLIGNRVFGCDDCLEVCPWNRFARQAR